jgi:prophage DNA circulation protein
LGIRYCELSPYKCDLFSLNDLPCDSRYKRQAQALELRLAAMKSKSTDASRRMGEADLVAFSDEKARLSEANAKLQEKNADLRDEVEELRAMVEVLKGQVSGRRGVISNPRSSPIISPSISPRISFS